MQGTMLVINYTLYTNHKAPKQYPIVTLLCHTPGKMINLKIQISIFQMCLQIIQLQSQPNLPWNNVLTPVNTARGNDLLN